MRRATDPALARFAARIARRDATARHARRARTACLALGLAAAFGLALGGADLRDAWVAVPLGVVAAGVVGWRIEKG